jgi:hypothetical protein
MLEQVAATYVTTNLPVSAAPLLLLSPPTLLLQQPLPLGPLHIKSLLLGPLLLGQ